MKLYAMVGDKSHDYITYGGRVLVHYDVDELHFLFPNMRLVTVKENLQRELMMLRDHPDMASVTFPLKRSDFRC